MLRKTTRKIRLFFGGNADPDSYGKSPTMARIRERFGMLNRADIIATLLSHYGATAREIIGDQDIASIRAESGTVDFAITKQDTRISDRQWLPTLSLCDVALCPPGVWMPYSHNIIETMAVGTIPLTNYPEWFNPPLVHGRDCIAFGNSDDFIAKVQKIFEMTAAELSQMSRNVKNYYDTYLAPDAFLEKLHSHRPRSLRFS